MIMNNSVIFSISSVNNSIFKKRNKVHARPLPFHRPKKGLVGVKYDNVGRVHKKGSLCFD